MVTWRRSSGSSRGGAAVGAAGFSPTPHSVQNRAPGWASAPQLGQAAASALPHAMQKRAPSGFSVEQAGQIGEPILRPPYASRGALATAALTRNAGPSLA